jgi:DNA modification methylase
MKTPPLQIDIRVGDCRQLMREMADDSVQCCVTSPPYFGLRDYGHTGQIGQEKTPEAFVATMVEVFRDVRRVLKPDGTCWLNLGDSYSRSPAKGGSGPNGKNEKRWGYGKAQSAKIGSSDGAVGRAERPGTRSGGLGEKQLLGIPWRVAFALQADGWYLRQDIIWSKPNPMPESVTDRCTKSHEYIFLLTKSAKYYYDAEAIRNQPSEALIQQVTEGYNGHDTKDYAEVGAQSASGTKSRIVEGARKKIQKTRGHEREHEGFRDDWDCMTKAEQQALGSNKRSVWTVATAPYREAHFATYPPDLIKPCILAGTKPGDIVLDPFGGSGTTGQVALELGRRAILCELNPDYVGIIHNRTNVTPGLAL